MTPTIAGRLQTRLALAVVPGLPAAAFAAATLDKLPPGDALTGLGIITLLGFGWDAAHQAIQDRRWDRDWPRIFTLASWVPEAFGSWLVLEVLGAAAPLGTHLAFFTLLWGAALVFRVAVLPVLLPRWRHEGQRLVGTSARTTPTAAVAEEPAAAVTEEPVTVSPAPEPATKGPARRGTPKRSGLGTLGIQPATGRLAALALFFGVVGALVLLAPLLGDKDEPVTAEARLTTSDGAQSVNTKLSPHVHEDGEVHLHDEDGTGVPAASGGGGADEKGWDTTKRVVPAYIDFEAADLATPLKMTLMKPDGVLVTPNPETAAWFGQGAAPGQRGPAVVIGSTDAVFKGIANAERGQKLRVIRADRSEVTFVVDSVTTVDARDFPTQKVYGANPDPLLRLVGFDETSGRNTIVFAHAVSMKQSPAED